MSTRWTARAISWPRRVTSACDRPTIDGVPVLGVAYQPVKDALYFARRGQGAFVEVDGATRPLGTSRAQLPSEVRVGISRLNPDEGLGKCLAAAGLAARAVQMGASAKHMALARGEIDAVLNLSAAEQEWDTCAPEVILTEAGCTVTDGDGNPSSTTSAIYSGGGAAWRATASATRSCCGSWRPVCPNRRAFEHAKQENQAGHQHGQPGGQRDQQQPLHARAGGASVQRDVGNDQVRVLREHPAEQDQRRLRRDRGARQPEALVKSASRRRPRRRR